MCILSADATTKQRIKDVLKLDKIRASIPKEAFVKHVPTSLMYMAFDYAMWGASTYGLWHLHSTGIYDTLPVYQQYAATLLSWMVSGFFMWCMFVIGHDCGHGSFSTSTIANDIIGHIAHGTILVPYWPWRLSHQRHHQNHNHVDNDYSHPWYTKEKLEQPDFGLARMMENYPAVRLLFPLVGWPIYLYGLPDGSHWIPFGNERLWKDTDIVERMKCVISTFWCVVNAYGAYILCNESLVTTAYYYGMPLMVFGWWLVCVTYLQHHDHDTLVYDDNDWAYTMAAFETVDRQFGYGIDKLHHHITDGHVAHHLFFRSIPHYNLPIATKAIREYLQKNLVGDVYKFEKTPDFAYRLHSYMYQFGFRATQAPKEKKVN